MLIPFVWSGTEAEFRALSPAPSDYWGKWTFAPVGAAFVGVFDAASENVRAHTNVKLTFLPSHGSNALSDVQVAACAPLAANIGSSDTLSSAIGKLHAINSADFLHPDRF